MYFSTCLLSSAMGIALKWQNVTCNALLYPRGSPKIFIISLIHLITGSFDAFFTARIGINFVNVCIITETYMLPVLIFTKAPKWSMWILWNDWKHIGTLLSASKKRLTMSAVLYTIWRCISVHKEYIVTNSRIVCLLQILWGIAK